MSDERGTGDAATGLSAARIATLSPGYFALVMATGIVSIAASQQGFDGLGDVLLRVNASAYVRVVGADARPGRRGIPAAWSPTCESTSAAPRFLTIVAGTNVLGSQVALLTSSMGWRSGSGWLAGGLWVVLLYAFFVAVTCANRSPRSTKG